FCAEFATIDFHSMIITARLCYVFFIMALIVNSYFSSNHSCPLVNSHHSLQYYPQVDRLSPLSASIRPHFGEQIAI
ncbi:MAG: hypothetical protein AB2669_05735, partial [Candidatus Thiodiazotropha endolucinida]